ncbi:unnamed protein product, partial [Discosporangium mesarthrocarpum]
AQEELAALQSTNESAQDRINNVEAPWTTELKDAVTKLSRLFEKYMNDMRCQGEVGLRSTDEKGNPLKFYEWGLEIKVRFRMTEDIKLQTLSHQVHSGGERSVSTILFLMALQDLQISPFRVVDEINQGMDPANERLVFSRIVRNSCGPERQQYFLVTPKLLQGLVAMDNEDVTVIFVNNGAYSLKGLEENNIENFLSRKRKIEAAK